MIQCLSFPISWHYCGLVEINEMCGGNRLGNAKLYEFIRMF